jgi:hypothetical protein
MYEGTVALYPCGLLTATQTNLAIMQEAAAEPIE